MGILTTIPKEFLKPEMQMAEICFEFTPMNVTVKEKIEKETMVVRALAYVQRYLQKRKKNS